MEQNDKDILFAKWLNNALSAEELALLEKSGDLELLRKIISVADNWDLPDLRQDGFENLQKKISAKREVKIIPLYKRKWVLGIAASLLLFAGVFWIFNANPTENNFVEYSSLPGQSKHYVLEDCTQVTLYGNSKIRVARQDFSTNRKVKMEGDVYFDVRKKGNFEVVYADGSVKVLGTRFRILSDSLLSSVKCYEGKVEVKIGTERVELKKGNGVRNDKLNGFVQFSLPNDTLTSDTRFENVPLTEVCASLSVYFNTRIIGTGVDMNRNFTGRFSVTNLDTALTMVCSPMNIEYRKKGNVIYLMNK